MYPQKTDDTYENLKAYVELNPQDTIHIYTDGKGQTYITYNDRIPDIYLADGLKYTSSIFVCKEGV